MIDYNIKIAGAAGQGMQTIGQVLSKAFLRGGYHVFTLQSYHSRIRGGHTFFQIRISDRPVSAMDERADMLIALNQESVQLHGGKLKEPCVILYDASAVKECAPKAACFDVPFVKLAKETGGEAIYANAVAVGAAMGIIDFGLDLLEDIFVSFFEAKHKDAAIEANVKAAKAGYDFAKNRYKLARRIKIIPKDGSGRILINGNEAIALGALAAGCKFYSAYPMTPSTSIMLTVTKFADDFGVVVEQTEDEIAAINMAIGAAYTGVRAMTATSGGGLALMVEGISLAGMTETPVVIADAQRPAPATGLPTRTEQGDLEFVLYSGHGEFPRIVFAPGSPKEAFDITIKAFDLAEKYQIPVFILTDQYLADSLNDMDESNIREPKINRYLISDAELKKSKEYKRYLLTADGISPRAIPGQAGVTVIADSDEHTEDGHLTEDLDIRVKMVDKRLKKMDGIRREAIAPTISGDRGGDTAVLCWGSTRGPAKEAVDILNRGGKKIKLIHLSQIWPFSADALKKELGGIKSIWMIEGNATGQLANLIKRECGIDINNRVLRYDGMPFSPEYIAERISKA